MISEEDEIVSQLEEMLQQAKNGKVHSLAYFFEGDGRQTWGFIGMSANGKLFASAQLASLAVKKEDSQ